MNFFKYPVPLNKKSIKILIYLTLILGVFLNTYAISIQNGMHQALSGGGRHLTAMAIAISEMKYDSKGYIGYVKVLSLLRNQIDYNPKHLEEKALFEEILTDDELLKKEIQLSLKNILTDGELLNNVIQKALEFQNVSSKGYISLLGEDLGIIYYYKLAFKIFGYKIEGLFYLYFLLLLVSIVTFMVIFYQRIHLWNILLLFVCSHFVIVAAAPSAGSLTVHDVRFITVLAIIPTLYLALLILEKLKLTLITLIGTITQVGILVLSISIRTAAIYQLMFLTTIFSLSILWYWRQNPKMGQYLLTKIRFWPLVIVFIGFFILKMYLLFSLNHSYVNSKKMFWHSAYTGLRVHPDSGSKIEGGSQCDDNCVQRMVDNFVYERDGISDFGKNNYQNDLYESIVKEEYMKIVIQDPRYFVENYLYKFVLFFKRYFGSIVQGVNYYGSTSYKTSHYLFHWTVFCLVLMGSILAGNVFLKHWVQYFFILILWLAFSLLPSMVYLPLPPMIANPAFIFTILIYFMISGAVNFTAQYLRLRFALTNKLQLEKLS